MTKTQIEYYFGEIDAAEIEHIVITKKTGPATLLTADGPDYYQHGIELKINFGPDEIKNPARELNNSIMDDYGLYIGQTVEGCSVIGEFVVDQWAIYARLTETGKLIDIRRLHGVGTVAKFVA